MQKISGVLDPEIAAQRPKLILGCRAEVTMVSGQTHVAVINGIPGNESNPLPKQDIARKFIGLSQPVLGTEANEAFERVWNVGEAESFDDVLAACIPQDPARK
jgi:hypothetical protein